LVVVGGGVLGVMHAFFARQLGFEVVHLERELAPRGASVRNFGLVWVGGRAGGPELSLARRARELWASVATSVEGVGFRAAGSLTVATNETELALMKEACERPDAALRQWELLEGPAARSVNPGLSYEVLGALWCRADAVVEPRRAVHALREHLLLAEPGYRWLPGREAVELAPAEVRDDRGERHAGERVFLCPGAVLGGLVRRYLGEGSGGRPSAAAHVASSSPSPLGSVGGPSLFPPPPPALPTRRVRLQMLETKPYAGTVTTALADGDSMRYYPAFDLPGRALLPPQEEVAALWRAQLLVVQRLDGSLTIGDTHGYEEPFGFDLDEEIYRYLLAKASTLLCGGVPGVRRRWAGVYSELAPESGPERAPGSGTSLYWREELVPGVELVTGAGGRGMTCAPAIAEESLQQMGACRDLE
jgi:glycine/D-amino acid oxidase-like deaminating enzyme